MRFVEHTAHIAGELRRQQHARQQRSLRRLTIETDEPLCNPAQIIGNAERLDQSMVRSCVHNDALIFGSEFTEAQQRERSVGGGRLRQFITGKGAEGRGQRRARLIPGGGKFAAGIERHRLETRRNVGWCAADGNAEERAQPHR